MTQQAPDFSAPSQAETSPLPSQSAVPAALDTSITRVSGGVAVAPAEVASSLPARFDAGVAPVTEQKTAPIAVPPPAPAPRVISAAALAAWSKPGLCTASGDAAAVRDTLTAKFQLASDDERGQIYVDPRLDASSVLPIVGYLVEARETVARQLGVQPPPPRVFVYADQALMKAAACINDDAVAFYDGVLHVIAGRADMRESVIHEYAHHALFSAGMVGPAWAQEGIAMQIAGERWWQQPGRLRAVVDQPFDLDAMERSIPYKLPSAQAVAFYVESALLVTCVEQSRNWQLSQLFELFRAAANASNGATSYDLPELNDPDFLRRCATNPAAPNSANAASVKSP